MELWRHLEIYSEFHGSKIALTDSLSGEEISYFELWRAAKEIHAFFQEAKIKSILCISGNRTKTAQLYIAAIISGVDICVLESETPDAEIVRAVNSLKPDYFITVDVPRNDNLHTNVLDFDSINFEAFSGSECANEESGLEFDSVYTYGRQIVSTSGSTGQPKLLAISGRNLWKSAETFTKIYQLGADNVYWNYLPLSYLGGTFNLLLIPISSGGRIVLDRTFSSTSLIKFFKTVDHFQINTIWFIPTILRGLRRLSNRSTGFRPKVPQRLAFIGTSASSSEERRWLESIIGCQVYENYGLSETTFLFLEPLRQGESDGHKMRRYPGVRHKVHQDNLLEVKSEHLFDGYFDPNGVFTSQERDSWFATLDRVSNANDNFVLLGRERDVIKKGGTLINLAEIERVAREFATWGDVALIPINDEFYGENSVLFFESRKVTTDRNGMLIHLGANLSKSKMPGEVLEIEEIPKTVSGKIDKSKLASAYLRITDRGNGI